MISNGTSPMHCKMLQAQTCYIVLTKIIWESWDLLLLVDPVFGACSIRMLYSSSNITIVQEICLLKNPIIYDLWIFLWDTSASFLHQLTRNVRCTKDSKNAIIESLVDQIGWDGLMEKYNLSMATKVVEKNNGWILIEQYIIHGYIVKILVK